MHNDRFSGLCRDLQEPSKAGIACGYRKGESNRKRSAIDNEIPQTTWSFQSRAGSHHLFLRLDISKWKFEACTTSDISNFYEELVRFPTAHTWIKPKLDFTLPGSGAFAAKLGESFWGDWILKWSDHYFILQIPVDPPFVHFPQGNSSGQTVKPINVPSKRYLLGRRIQRCHRRTWSSKLKIPTCHKTNCFTTPKKWIRSVKLLNSCLQFVPEFGGAKVASCRKAGEKNKWISGRCLCTPWE